MDLHSKLGLHVLLSAGFYLSDIVLNETQRLFVTLQVPNSSSSLSQLRMGDLNLWGEMMPLLPQSSAV